MKFPIEWHEKCLESVKASLASQQKALQDLMLDIERTKWSIELRETQLARAKKEGLTEYDHEKFCVKRGEKK